MEPEVIEKLIKKIHEVSKETITLYDLTESDMIVLTSILMLLPVGTISPNLLGRLLRAAAHLIERNEEISKEICDLWKR